MVDHIHLATVTYMVQFGLYTMSQNTSFGRQYQNVCAIVPVGYLVADVALLFVRYSASAATCGGAMGTYVYRMGYRMSTMNTITTASPAVDLIPLTATCEC